MMRRSLLAIALLLCSLLVLSACGQDATSYEDPEALAAALDSAGIPCADLNPGPQAELVSGAATCRSGDSRLGLYVFSSESDRDDWLKVGGQLGAAAIGPDWVVTGDEGIVEDAADALEADLNTTE